MNGMGGLFNFLSVEMQNESEYDKALTIYPTHNYNSTRMASCRYNSSAPKTFKKIPMQT